MRGRVALVSCLLSGCQLVFTLEEPPPVPCTTKARALVDDLTADTPFWDQATVSNPITYDTSGVHMVTNAAEQQSYVRQNVLYDLRQSSFSVEVDPGVELGPGDMMALSLISVDFDLAASQGLAIEIIRRDDTLVASYYEDGNQNEIDMVAFDPAVHQRWEISRQRDTTSWAVGPVGGEPLVIQTFELPRATFLSPQLSTYRATTANPPFTATFRNLNGDAEPEEVCGGEQLIDTFDGADIDRDTWGRSGPLFEIGCSFGIDGGDLAIAFETAGAISDACSMGSSGIYDLISHTFTIEVDAELPSTERVVVQVEMPDRNTANFSLENGELSAITEVNGVDTPARTVDYDPTAHRFWRFAGSIGADGLEQIDWLVSDNGRDFEFFASAGTVKGLDRVRFILHVTGGGAESAATRVRFPRVN